MELEYPFMRAPYEAWAKFARNSQKLLENEVKSSLAEAKKMAPAKKGAKDKSTDDAKQLTAFVTKMQGLKKKLEEMQRQSDKYLSRCQTRLEHVQFIDTNSKDASPTIRSQIARTRMHRFMVDHLLREGHYNAATNLAADDDIKELVDLELFVSARNVIDSLSSYDCSKALVWCVANRSKLKKIDSPLEFKLHGQEFVELLRAKNCAAAIKYAQSNLSPFYTEHATEVQEVMGALAFVNCPGGWNKYEKYFSPQRWTALIEQFRSDQFRLNGVTQHSLLDIALQAGLSALKTPSCGTSEHSNTNCPLCSDLIAKLASKLPYSQRVHSRIVCRITGEVMDEHNPPMCLPNGYVYSRNALTAMAKENGGKITCPRTNRTFSLTECKNVFIL